MSEIAATPSVTPPPFIRQEPSWGGAEIIKAILLIVVGFIGLSAIAVGVAMATGFDPTADQGMSSPLLFALGMGIYGLMILAVYWFAVRRPDSSWGQAGLRPFAWGWAPAAFGLLWVVLGAVALINARLVPLITGAEFENPQIEAITGGLRLSVGDLLLLLLLIAIVAPLAEELFFRGMVYPVMRRRWGAGWAIPINALFFALVHFIPVLIPGLFLMGLILAWMRERSGSIGPGILLHVFQNGLVVLVIFASTRI